MTVYVVPSRRFGLLVVVRCPACGVRHVLHEDEYEHRCRCATWLRMVVVNDEWLH